MGKYSSAVMGQSVRFYDHLKVERRNPNYNCVFMNGEKYELLISKVKSLKSGPKRDCSDYRFLKRYDMLEVTEITKLIQPVSEEGNLKYSVYDVLHDANVMTGYVLTT